MKIFLGLATLLNLAPHQPPEIRHRVLRSGDGLEVVEIGVPADHATVLDHEMALPNNGREPGDAGRTWRGQRFTRFIKGEQESPDDDGWRTHRLPGFEARDTGIAKGTQVGRHFKANLI